MPDPLMPDSLMSDPPMPGPSMPELVLADPRDASFDLLMARHKAAMHADTPPESIHMLDRDALAVAGIAFFALRDGSGTPGMGALKRIDATHAEIKSMHILAEARGRGLAQVLLAGLIAQAKAAGYARVSLETGAQPGFAPARRLYLAAGFTDCLPFADYGPDPYSVFMTRALD